MHFLMCSPDNFDVEYVINPWMNVGTVDRDRALEQWNTLRQTYQDLGVTVSVVNQPEGVPDMVFAADQGVVNGKTVILAKFRYPERQAEQPFYETWFKEQGFVTQHLSDAGYFEGGDLVKLGDQYLLGVGFRSNETAASELSQHLGKPVTALELINDNFYHLDTCLLVLDDQTAFYYPPAFSKKALEILQNTIPKLAEFTREEVDQFAANSVVIGKTVVTTTNLPTFHERLNEAGFSAKYVDMSEFLKAGGGPHCLIMLHE